MPLPDEDRIVQPAVEPTRMRTAVVVGAGGAIGGALVRQLLDDAGIECVHAWSRRPLDLGHEKLRVSLFEATDEASVALAAERVGTPDLVIVATGLLHTDGGAGPEKSWHDLDSDRLVASFLANAIGPALVAKHLLGRLPRDRRAVFAALSARVGSIGDNRLGGWYGYRASKAALNQLIKCLAIELARSRPQAICVGLHPGTVDSRLSKPFQSALASDRLFTPERAAAALIGVIGGLTPAETGGFFAWDGRSIPF